MLAFSKSATKRGTVPSQLEQRPWHSTHKDFDSSSFTVSIPFRLYPSSLLHMLSCDFCSVLGNPGDAPSPTAVVPVSDPIGVVEGMARSTHCGELEGRRRKEWTRVTENSNANENSAARKEIRSIYV